MRNLTLFFTIFTFVVEPLAFMPRAEAMQCLQGPQKTEEKCTGNPTLKKTQDDTGFIQQGVEGKQTKEASQGLLTLGKKGQGSLEISKKQCTQMGEECMSSCDQEIGRKRVLEQDTSREEQAKQECKQEKEEGEKKMDSGLKEIMALIQALMGIIAALMGNKEDKPPEVAKDEEKEEDVCKTPEGAFLIECKCTKNSEGKCIIQSNNTGARLGGSTFGALGGGGGGSLDARPAAAVFESKLNDTQAASSTPGRGSSGGSSSFGAASTQNSGGNSGGIEAKGPDADIHKGYISGGGGGGFGSFGGGGGSKGGGSRAYSSNSGGGGSAKKILNRKLLKASSGRSPASFGGGKSGPFGDNFYTIKNAYKKQKSSMYKGQQ